MPDLLAHAPDRPGPSSHAPARHKLETLAMALAPLAAGADFFAAGPTRTVKDSDMERS